MSTPLTPEQGTTERHEQKQPTSVLLWCILGLVLLADAVDLIDSTVTNIAAPSIVRELAGGQSLIKWLGAAYALALGVLLVIGGRIGDKFGQRRMFLIGLSGFTVASCLCGLAPNPGFIIVARVLQGAFGAMLIPQGMSIMVRSFPRDMLGKAFSLYGPLLGISTIGGPILAGFIITADLFGLGWRPVFLINIVLGTIGVVAAWFILPHDAGDRTIRLDVLQSLYLAIAMFGMLFGLIEGSTNGWSWMPSSAIGIGVIGMILFVFRQRTSATPLLEPGLFRNRGFVAGLGMGLAYFAVVAGLSYVTSLYLQDVLHKTPSETALALVPMTIGIIVASFTCMGLIAKLGRVLVFIGLGLTLIGVTWMWSAIAMAGATATVWSLVLPILVVGLGMGTCFGTIFDLALGNVSAEQAGSASGSMSAIQQLANGIGSAAVTSVYFQVSSKTGAQTPFLAALMVVVVIVLVCLPVAALLPKRAAIDTHGM